MRLEQGEVALARAWFEESLVIVQEVGDRDGVLETLLGLARVAVAQGDLAEARRRYQQGLTTLHEMGSQQFLAVCLEGLAALETGQGEPRQAARLWGAAEVLREVMGTPMHPVDRASYEQARAQTRATLGEQAFAAAWAEGRMLTPEQALAPHAEAMIPTPMPSRPDSAPSMRSPSFPAGLTGRERDVLRLLAQGLSDAQIAAHLVISPRTVNRHTTSLYSKLGVTSRAAATRFAIEHHVL
jgi:ATP/maltotriose-dependent transcriptional regulator MalT